ncbi:MAG TPA: phospho-sugar mutase [Cytophagales bacterium]|nr:phospho-sugar mutase [Cytophagales bacterium]
MEQIIQDKINTWLGGNYDDKTKEEIKRLQRENKVEELTDSFYRTLEFGTGGLRGLMGVGSNRMNKYTVGAATQGLANYLKKSFPDEQIKVAIAYDSRNNSKYFAEVTANVFSANGIKVYLFKELRPTPELSFAIRHFNCHSGVVVTASHNPKEYNGYKVYWNDGSQVIAPHDKNIINEVNNIQSIDEIKFESKENKVELIGEEIDKLYLDKLYGISLSGKEIKNQHDLKIVFSPIHGTGITLVPKALEKLGFTNVTVVKEQSEPNGNFPTVVYPNPEEKDAMSLSVKKAREIDADIVMATDPDADRVGIAVKNHKNEFQLLNGNQTGTLIFSYLIERWRELGKLTGKEYIAKTIVTTDLIDKIAQKNGVECYNVLTGFKYIAGLMREFEGKKTFIAGAEESYGYLIGDFVRDKDAIASCAIIAEIAAYAKDKGFTLYDWLLNIYVEYGYYKEDLISLTKKGRSGAEEIKAMMNKFRSNPPALVNGKKLIKISDYENSVERDLITGKETKIELPKSDVLQFLLEDGTKISARPSGTEPKIKFYFSVNESLASKENFDKTSKTLNDKIENIINDLQLR